MNASQCTSHSVAGDLDDNLFAIARAYPEDARYTPATERDRHFTITQKLAWVIRFGTVEDCRTAFAEAFR